MKRDRRHEFAKELGAIWPKLASYVTTSPPLGEGDQESLHAIISERGKFGTISILKMLRGDVRTSLAVIGERPDLSTGYNNHADMEDAVRWIENFLANKNYDGPFVPLIGPVMDQIKDQGDLCAACAHLWPKFKIEPVPVIGTDQIVVAGHPLSDPSLVAFKILMRMRSSDKPFKYTLELLPNMPTAECPSVSATGHRLQVVIETVKRKIARVVDTATLMGFMPETESKEE